MGIWDKGKVLGAGDMLTETYAEGEHFALFAMASAGEADLGNGLPPANKTVMLAQRVESDAKNKLTLVDEPKVVGTFSQPIAGMAAESSDSDFPVVVCWRKVTTKSDREATVLDLVTDRDVPKLTGKTPAQWGMYS